MILLQLSAGQGPLECCRAVALALQLIEKQCAKQRIELKILESTAATAPHCYKSVLVQLSDKTASGQAQNNSAHQLALSWQGAMLWVCQSPFRTKHKRKNWFFGGQMYLLDDSSFNHPNSDNSDAEQQISFQTCRSSGAGGQHVNTTDSAVRATHIGSGISVRVESERSQHANKRLAKALLFHKLEQREQQQTRQQEHNRWQQHWELERGNPKRCFTGEKFNALS